MGRIVAAACVAHSPGLTGFPEKADPKKADAVLGGFSELASAVSVSGADAIVMVSGEHFTNFFVSNFPAFAVGTATDYQLPATEAFSSFLRIPFHRYPGHPALGDAVYRGLLARDFDPSLVAGGYGFDEGFAVPLTLLVGDDPIPVVPVIVNSVHEPYPTLRRCHALGVALGEIIESQDVAERVAVLGTGGLSHWVGLARAGEIDEAFDRRVIEALEKGEPEGLLNLSDAEIEAAGNGAHEIRSWLVAAAAAGHVPFTQLAYEPVPAWLTGTCVMQACTSDGPTSVGTVASRAAGTGSPAAERGMS